LLEVKVVGTTDSLQVLITPSQIVIASTQNKWLGEGKEKGSIKLMKIPIA
jgi:hypothetical protein